MAKSKKKTEEVFHFCNQPVIPKPIFSDNVSPKRAALIINNQKKWINGTQLKYYFFGNENRNFKGTKGQEQKIRDAFKKWKSIGIGLFFEEVSDPEESHIRIGFEQGAGSWSYIGRDVLTIPLTERTMNIGWNEPNLDTEIHEIGHTLGLFHEHQNPNAGITWNEEKVYQDLGGPPNNWDRETTHHNILRKIDPSMVMGSSWDADSIMHYPLGKGWIKEPREYRDGLQPKPGLSMLDKETIKSIYPSKQPYPTQKMEKGQFIPIVANQGEQQDFIFTPRWSRKRKIETIGNMDTVLIISEKISGKELEYLAGDDNSGTDLNAFVKLRLPKKRDYLIQVRVMYKDANSIGGIVIS